MNTLAKTIIFELTYEILAGLNKRRGITGLPSSP
jgi:hypothetical protein